jgi:hypothetical protein
VEPTRARELWTLFEPVHAVTYFDPECIEAFATAGLKGFWMGYFAGRSCPLGAVGPGPVGATFFSFHPARVARAVPDCWGFTRPETVRRVRSETAARALRRLCPGVEGAAEELNGVLGRLVAGAQDAGRVLFAANRDLGIPDDPVEALWQLTTCLREHRGDGHVAALTSSGLGPCEALVLFARSEGIPDQVFLAARGWSEADWGSSVDALSARGLIDRDGVTRSGRAMRDRVESTTDALAAGLFSGASETELGAIFASLGGLAGALAAQSTIPYPNPIGLPPPDRQG